MTIEMVTPTDLEQMQDAIQRIDAKLDDISDRLLQVADSANGAEQLVDIRKAAVTLGLSVSTLRSWILDGSIPYRKVGKRVLFAKEDLRSIIEDRKINPIGD